MTIAARAGKPLTEHEEEVRQLPERMQPEPLTTANGGTLGGEAGARGGTGDNGGEGGRNGDAGGGLDGGGGDTL
eukprot:3549978-Prymnesium_polylepis.1